MTRPKPMRIGEALLSTGDITEDQLRSALDEQKRSGTRLGEVLVDQGIVTSDSLLTALARCHDAIGVRIRHGLVDPALIEMIGREEAERMRCLPLFRVRDELTVAMTDPTSLPIKDRLRELTGCSIRPVFAMEANILEFIRKAEGGRSDVDEFLTTLSESDLSVIEKEAIDESHHADLDRMVDGSPIVNLVNLAVLTAIRNGASDIHVEPSEAGTRIRSRVDGVLRDLMRPPMGMHAAIVSRLKVIGKMDIAQKRLPQEGRVRLVAEGREIDLRVSSMPTLLGEKVVMRILDKKNLSVRLDKLGFDGEALRIFEESLVAPHGMVLVTGPTGSGKTTTLYSALDLLRSPETNIVTVEDPVEYQLDLINQIQVNEQVGLSFVRSLRSILRQDPDVIMIGEIRDEETARVALQAALTGHRVLATLHTNDSASAVARLRNMGLESYLIASALTCVVAQRLVRTNCQSCLTAYHPGEQALDEAELSHMSGRSFRKGEGCPRCHDSGFEGRVGVYEVMDVGREMQRLIAFDAGTQDLQRRHSEQGGRFLREQAVAHAVAGLTSLEEALRVTRAERAWETPGTGDAADAERGAA